MPLFGEHMLHQIKAPQFYTDLGLLKTVLNPLANGKIQGLFTRPLSVYQVLFKANFISSDFSRYRQVFSEIFLPSVGTFGAYGATRLINISKHS